MVEATGRITLWGIEVFMATADEQSISAAARRLGASPSAVSQQLSNLETALGAVLLNRRERPVTLTPAGQIMRRRAQVILNEAAQARAELSTVDITALTQLRLGMIEDFDADVTPHLLSEMAGDLDQTQFLLETGPSHRLLDLLDTRALDVVVAADMGAPAEWMEVHPLLSEPFVAAAPRGAITGDALAALQKLPLIQYTSRHHMGRLIADHLARQNLTLSHRFELDSYHAIMAMVAGGAGWTILTPLGVMHARRFLDDVDVTPLPFAPLTRTISLSARKGVLGAMPGQVAQRLRPLLSDLIVAPVIARHPFLAENLRVL
ncbi:MAG: DNA-binding transcriptional LysR family regulator [Halocynthiibacter sp.]|jgi:DNA-binding transcriptional LysR family regulator